VVCLSIYYLNGIRSAWPKCEIYGIFDGFKMQMQIKVHVSGICNDNIIIQLINESMNKHIKFI